MFEAVLKNIAASDDESLSSSSDSDESQPFKTFGVFPQVGSLAAALGMVVDPSAKAPAIGYRRRASRGGQFQQLMNVIPILVYRMGIILILS